MQVRKNPFVGLIEPDLPIPFLPPARRTGPAYLVGWMSPQIVRRRQERKHLLIVIRLANHIIDELRPFIPPVPEQLGVIGGDHQRRPIPDPRPLPDLPDSG